MWRLAINSLLQKHPDHFALLLFSLLWAILFWRVLTPIDRDAVSLREGDFSGQFVSWTSYSVERLSSGELPLWNPYMNAGAPFMADPQTAVYYPPRLFTVFQLTVRDATTNGDVYAALQLEMVLHVWLGGVLMYAFLRRLLREHEQHIGIVASFAAASVFAFGGYMSAYPQLQLPILESAIWAPLVFLCAHIATENQATIRWNWLIGAAGALTFSILGGHPQTYVLITYAVVTYVVYRLWNVGWRRVLLVLLVLGTLTAGLSALQVLPSLEFQQQTYRQEFGFDDKSNGLAAQDIVQVLFPGVLSEWSPLYIGIAGLLLVAVVMWRSAHAAAFWLGMAVVGLVLSFGRILALYSVFYVLLPGYSLFRGQERVVLLVVFALSVLVGYGVVALSKFKWTESQIQVLRRGLAGLVVFCGVFALVFFFLRLQPPDGEIYQTALQATIYATVMIAVTGMILLHATRVEPKLMVLTVLVGVLVFDLLSINLNNANFETVPATDRLLTPAHIPVMQANLALGQHAEGLRGVRQSYGTLYRVPDIWGDSPLRLDAMDYYLWRIPIENRWELLGVQVVNSEWGTLPVPAQIVGQGQDVDGGFNIFQLSAPRPFAHLVYNVDVMDGQAMRDTLAGLDYDLRHRVMLEEQVAVSDGSGQTSMVVFDPEYIELEVETDAPGVLTLALPYTSGWNASVDGKNTDILKAYDGLTALAVPPGTYNVILRYEPLSAYAGLGISVVTLILCGIGFVVQLRKDSKQDAA